MKFQPLVSWWMILIYALAVAGYAVWQIRQMRRKDKHVFKNKPLARLWVRRISLLALPALVAAGPSVQGGVSSPGVTNLDVVFAVDTTPSVGALDYAGSRQRLEGMKQDMLALAASLKGAHIEIITFDTEANIILPLTTDTTAFSAAVEGLAPQINSYSKGSTIDKPISLITKELKFGSKAYPDHFRLLFYLGDGEQTATTAVKSFSSASRYLSGGAVLGYGTAKGAKMTKYTGIPVSDASPTYITTVDTATNKLIPAISKMDAAALKKIASELKVTYQDRNKGGSVTELYDASQAKLAVDKSQRVIHYMNLYWLCAIPLVVLFFWEWQALIFKLFELRDQHTPKKPKPTRKHRA